MTTGPCTPWSSWAETAGRAFRKPLGTLARVFLTVLSLLQGSREENLLGKNAQMSVSGLPSKGLAQGRKPPPPLLGCGRFQS